MSLQQLRRVRGDVLPQTLRRHQDKIFLACPFRFSGHPARDLECLFVVMDEGERSVMLNRKKPVGDGDEHPAGNPANLAYQKQLIFHTTRMLEYSVGCRYLEAAVIKRQPDIRLNLKVADERKTALELKAGTEPASSNAALMRVASFKHVCALTDDIRYAQVENLI